MDWTTSQLKTLVLQENENDNPQKWEKIFADHVFDK